jgi:hypothetical protein
MDLACHLANPHRMEPQPQLFKARVEQVIDHMMLSVVIYMPFGMAIERVVRVIDSPAVDSTMAAAAKAAMVTLCGGKKVVLLAMPEQYEKTIDARVGATHPRPPVGLELRAVGDTTLDAGLALAKLRAVAFAKSEVVRLLHG